MKLKQLFLAIFVTSVLFVSCTKEDVYTPTKQTSTVTTESLTMKSMSTSPTVSGTVNKAYVFIESRINKSPRKVVDYLQTTQRNPLSTGTRFLSYFTSVGIFNSNFRDLVNYYSIPLWNSDSHLKVIEADVPQVNGV